MSLLREGYLAWIVLKMGHFLEAVPAHLILLLYCFIKIFTADRAKGSSVIGSEEIFTWGAGLRDMQRVAASPGGFRVILRVDVTLAHNAF